MIVIRDNHGPRLLRADPARVTPALGRQLELGAEAIVEDAQFSIKDGAISGAGHIPSLPGEAPNADTHVLDESIHAGELTETPGVIRSSAIADAPYAAFLELGTSRMHERPFLRPATQRQRPNVIRGLALRFREVVGI